MYALVIHTELKYTYLVKELGVEKMLCEENALFLMLKIKISRLVIKVSESRKVFATSWFIGLNPKNSTNRPVKTTTTTTTTTTTIIKTQQENKPKILPESCKRLKKYFLKLCTC